MTPFVQLGQMTKQALTPAAAGYKYQKTSTGLNDPYAPQVATAPKGMSANLEMTGDLIAGGLGMIPGLGGIANGVWQGGKAIYHGATGQYGKAAEDLAWGAAGFIPGAAMAGAVGKGAKLIPGAARALSAARPTAAAVGATRAGGMAIKAAPFAKELAGDTITGTAAGGVASGVSSAVGLKNNPAYQPPTAPPPPTAQQPAWLQQAYDQPVYSPPTGGRMDGLGRPYHPYMR